jgi:hypothetical protein
MERKRRGSMSKTIKLIADLGYSVEHVIHPKEWLSGIRVFVPKRYIQDFKDVKVYVCKNKEGKAILISDEKNGD